MKELHNKCLSKLGKFHWTTAFLAKHWSLQLLQYLHKNKDDSLLEKTRQLAREYLDYLDFAVTPYEGSPAASFCYVIANGFLSLKDDDSAAFYFTRCLPTLKLLWKDPQIIAHVLDFMEMYSQHNYK